MTEAKDNCWVATFSGGSFDLLRPQPSQVKLADIAHMLSRTARFSGATLGSLPWNVAQHSLLVEWLLPGDSTPETRLHALLHDAHEAYVGDVKTPVKQALTALGGDERDSKNFRYIWHALTMGINCVVWQSVALEVPTPEQIEQVNLADLRALFIEKDQLLAPCERDWGLERPDMPDVPLWTAPVLRPAMPDEAKAMFVERVRALIDLRHGIA